MGVDLKDVEAVMEELETLAQKYAFYDREEKEISETVKYLEGLLKNKNEG